MPWRLHLRVSERRDGTGADAFYSTKESFKSFRLAKKAAKGYSKAAKRGEAPWFREARVYREGEE